MKKNIIRRFAHVIVSFIITGILLFLSAGTIHWLWAWLFLGICLLVLVFNFFVMPRDLIEERGKVKKDTKHWDKVLTSLAIIPFFLIYACCGLDYRFGWTGEITAAYKVSGLVLTFTGYMIFTWAMTCNKFFSTEVRLQTDRGHYVATGGPYRWVRHPGYVGYCLTTLATPLALGTLWGLTFAVIIVAIFIYRTYREDNTLHEELPGYAEYAERVKYRLIPYVW